MNGVLRECFVDLYTRPLLEELKKTWELQYPSLEFPDLPETGDMDLDEVKHAPYFFQRINLNPVRYIYVTVYTH